MIHRTVGSEPPFDSLASPSHGIEIQALDNKTMQRDAA